jgi:hypothetical protein
VLGDRYAIYHVLKNRFEKKNRPVRAKKPVPYGIGQKRFGGAVRTGGVCEPIGPTSFLGSSPVLVTLLQKGNIHGAMIIGILIDHITRF